MSLKKNSISSNNLLLHITYMKHITYILQYLFIYDAHQMINFIIELRALLRYVNSGFSKVSI